MKKKMRKRALALFWVLTMALSAFCVNVYAVEPQEDYRLLFDYCNFGPWEGTCTITGYEGTLPESLVIPNTQNGYWVVFIAEKAFAGCTALRKVEATDLVVIEEGAFAECENLETVTLTGSYDDFCIRDYAFKNCNKLKIFDCTLGNGDMHIGTGAFIGCSALESVTMYCAWVDENAFLGCDSFKKVSFLGYKPDYCYNNPDEMVSKDGNAVFLAAEHDWVQYPYEMVGRSYDTISCWNDKDILYTTGIADGGRIISRNVHYTDAGCFVRVDVENILPNTVRLHTSLPWYSDGYGQMTVVLITVDGEGQVEFEQFVTVKVFERPSKMVSKCLQMFSYAESIRDFFRIGNQAVSRLVDYFTAVVKHL